LPPANLNGLRLHQLPALPPLLGLTPLFGQTPLPGLTHPFVPTPLLVLAVPGQTPPLELVQLPLLVQVVPGQTPPLEV
jgi:hypothetical protein